MSREFQTRLRAERAVRPLTSLERFAPIVAWTLVSASIATLILVTGGDGVRWIASAPAAVGVMAVVKGLKRKEITDLTDEGKAEVLTAKKLDRQDQIADAKRFFKSWFGRLLISGAVVAASFFYAQQGPTSGDEREVLLLLCAGAAIWAWQTSLALLACGFVWWVTTLDWHLSTPTAVIIGAVIIAGAVRSKK